MSDATTPNYNFTLPTIGGSQDSWGNKLNANWTALDGLLHGFATDTGFLPTTGGVITGSLSVQGTLQTSSTLGVQGLAAFAYPTVSDFYIYRTGGFRVLHWSNSDQVVWAESGAVTSWQHNSSTTMSLDAAGNLTVAGNGFKPGGGSWAAASDDRVKRNARRYGAGLADVCELLPIAFEYNGAGGTVDDGVTRYGLSAQAAQRIMPELVFEMAEPGLDGSTDPQLLPGQLGTQLGPLTLALVNSCRELAERVAALELKSA